MGRHHFSESSRPIIALDADGVLLDYHAAYRQAWYRAFGIMPEIRDSLAYWPIDRWEVRRLEGSELAHFRSFFDQEFWSSIPPAENAVQACTMLVDAGFELICVSAMAAEFQARDCRICVATVSPLIG